MKTIRVLDSSGDRVIRFDDAEESAVARAQAENLFAELLNEGSTAFKVNRSGGRRDEKVTDFSQLENETVVIPRVVGG